MSNQDKIFERYTNKLALSIFIIDLLCFISAIYLIVFLHYNPVIAFPSLFFSVLMVREIRQTRVVIP